MDDREARVGQPAGTEAEKLQVPDPPPGVERRELLRMFAIGVALSAIGTWLVLKIDWFPAQGATAAKDIDFLYDLLLVFSVPIFILVMAIAGFCVVRFRAKPGDTGDGPPIHGNTRLEVIWVMIPFLIVSGLAVYSWIVLDDIEAAQPNELVVDVTGQQFAWGFEYKEAERRSTELVLPKDQPTRFDIRTNDVIHSFWVPEFRLKQDAVRGITTRIRLTPSKTGSWQIVCAELCGIGHSTMRQRVRVVERSEFDSWLAEQPEIEPDDDSAAAAEPEGGEESSQ